MKVGSPAMTNTHPVHYELLSQDEFDLSVEFAQLEGDIVLHDRETPQFVIYVGECGTCITACDGAALARVEKWLHRFPSVVTSTRPFDWNQMLFAAELLGESI